MSKLKKVLLMCTAYVLVAALAIGGTIAYLTSEDSDVNVMTLGNVSIEQIEQERDAEGNLVDFTQAKPAYPAVGPVEWDETLLEVNEGEYKVFTDELKNVVDKIVTVNNTGKTDAYVRTVVAIEAPDFDPNDLIHINYSKDVTISDPVTFTMDGVDYVAFAFTYPEALAAGAKSAPSLMQVFLDSEATNEDCAAFGDTWDILVLSQAIQAAGFDKAETALNTGFGEVNAENVAEWFGGVIVPRVRTLAELREALATGGEFALGADITVEKADMLYAADGGHQDGSAFFVKKDTVLDLNGHNITVASGNVWADAFFMKWGADLTIKGEGDITADCSVACVYDGNSTLNVEGGNFYVTANNDMLYSIYGKINVSGGTFTTSYWNTINIYGSGRTQLVDVSGGSFEGWNPATSPDGNLLADGYKTVSEVVDGVTWYTVVAE